MRKRLFLLLALLLPALGMMATSPAGTTACSGTVFDEQGQPVAGARIVNADGSALGTTDVNGKFTVNVPQNSPTFFISHDGFKDQGAQVSANVGTITLLAVEEDEYLADLADLTFDEAALEDEEGSSQSVSALMGANDNVFYNTASYNFGPMYYDFRGMDSKYQSVYLNGVKMNDLVRGSFSFSTLLGLTSRGFRNKTTTLGLEASHYGFGDVGGSVNFNTVTDTYAPGFNGSVAYTNSNYKVRAIASYASGLNSNGWAFTVNGIVRYADEGIMEGTFYNSAGLFLSLQKKFNPEHSLVLTAFGGPTQRATGRPTVQEAYDLAGTNLYNPDWGYQNGKKRSSRITETFDPTVMLNWLFKKENTTLNTSMMFRSVYYNRTALNYYNANDPNPSYYKYLPSYFRSRDDEASAEMYTELWQNDESFRQIKWDDLYQINHLNNEENKYLAEADKKGSSYIMENRTNHQLVGALSSYINTRINSWLHLQAGVSFNYTKSSNYKTIRDLMGGEFWIDVDPFSNREASVRPGNLQNDLDNPNRRVKEDDRFGYDYDIHAMNAEAWVQNIINLPKWDINYGLQVSYTQYYRDGKMRNGRAPANSLGKSATQRFDNAALKLGALYKLDGRNMFAIHLHYGTRAPLFDQVYIAPRIKNTVVSNIENERNLAGDIGYIWNYRRFRGSITGFYNQDNNAIERTGFYDDDYQTYANYILSGVKRVYKGVEIGMAYKITPSLTATFAGTYARYQYKNNPKGTRSFENGMYPDTTQTVYLKNYYLGSTPQYCANIGLDWAAPKNWYLGVNCTWQGDAYVNLAPRYHEALANLWETYGSSQEELEAKVQELAIQDKIRNAYSLNASIGKAIYINSVALNINLNLNNITNNRDIVTYAYQQGRLRETGNTAWDRNAYPTRFNYAQGFRMYLNVGVRF